jgi:acyl-CoA reductase-like NAD-dependent aldehyde dehydrogenase
MATIEQSEMLALEEPSAEAAKHWIGGQWLDSGVHRESMNPATGEVIGKYVKGGRKEAERGFAGLPRDGLERQSEAACPRAQ